MKSFTVLNQTTKSWVFSVQLVTHIERHLTRINLAKEVVYVFLWVILSVKRLEGLWYSMQWVYGFSWCHFPRGCFSFCLTKAHSIFETKSVSLWWRLDIDTLCRHGYFTHCFTNCPCNRTTRASSELVHQALTRNRGSNKVFNFICWSFIISWAEYQTTNYSNDSSWSFETRIIYDWGPW